MNTLLQELAWRGLLQDHTPELDTLVQKEKIGAYIGFDPTANSLHIGHLVAIILFKHLQNYGHRPIALVGGATGMIGDPSGKSEERKFLSEQDLNNNVQAIGNQLKKYLNFEGDNAATIVNNYDWLGAMSLVEFLREAGKHITVNYMAAKESVKKRMETGISFTEFSYQLLQGFDFYHLYTKHNCKVQVGGADQWGNITTGLELIRRKSGGDGQAFTFPLITKADGTKFGKSESGTVWLDAALTSPYQFYQFWLNVGDVEAAKYISLFTFLDQITCTNLIAEHAAAPHERALQKRLAQEITTFVHGEAGYAQVVQTTELLFGQSTLQDFKQLDSATFETIFQGIPTFEIEKDAITNSIDIISLLGEKTKLFSSKGEARKLIQGGGLLLNKEKVTVDQQISSSDLVLDTYIIIQKGKRNYFLLKTISI